MPRLLGRDDERRRHDHHVPVDEQVEPGGQRRRAHGGDRGGVRRPAALNGTSSSCVARSFTSSRPQKHADAPHLADRRVALGQVARRPGPRTSVAQPAGVLDDALLLEDLDRRDGRRRRPAGGRSR